MPTCYGAEFEVTFSRNAIVLDTNILLDYIRGDDGGDAQVLLDEFLPADGFGEYLVPTAVVVETFNMLHSRDKHVTGAHALLEWIIDPGSAVKVLPYPRWILAEARSLSLRLHVDLVDAIVFVLATHLTDSCQLRPALAVLTRDERDFPRARRDAGLKFRLFDNRQMTFY